MNAGQGSDERAVPCRLTWRRDWTPQLFSFRTVRPAGLRFAPGQFVRLGVRGAEGSTVWRAYSIVSPPAADELEFYSIVVPDGPFTQPLARLSVGDTILVDPTVYGFLRADRFDEADDLWLVASGTGIAPFVSMLADPAIWRRHRNLVVVHGVRREADLAYREELAARSAPIAGVARLTYRAALTGERVDDALEGRTTALFADGTLERSVGLPIAKETTRLLLCGNPSMIKEVRAWLVARGLAPLRRDVGGEFISENFW